MADYSGYRDEELVAFVKESDKLAFGELFNRYAELLVSFAYRNLYDRDDARDVVQDFFTDLWTKRSDLDIEKNFRGFIFIAVKNKVFDRYKHQKVVQRYLDHYNEPTQTPADSTDHLVRKHDLEALIAQEIAALPEKMRLVFELARKNNMSRKEIAEHLGLPEATVRTNMNRALKILKGKLGAVFLMLFL